MNDFQNPMTNTGTPSNKKYIIIGAVVVGLVVLYAVQSYFSPERIVERALEQGSGGIYDIDTNSDGTTMTIEGEDGTRVEMAGDGSASLPKDWPSELPVPDDVTIEYASTVTGADGTRSLSVTYSTTDSLASVAQEYTSALESNGWVIDSNSATAAWTMISAKKGEDAVVIYVTDNAGTISVTANLQLAAE